MFSRRLASIILRLLGWRSAFTPPPGPKSVIMFYPHTSNWDFPFGLLFKFNHDLMIHWAGKDSLFRWPFRRLFIRLGGVPINRRERTGMISQLLEVFTSSESFHICIAPEGTRSRTDHWKSGFYRLALAAKVPVGLGFIDYASRRVGVEDWVILSGNEETDLDMLRRYYADKKAYAPEKAGEIRFRSS